MRKVCFVVCALMALLLSSCDFGFSTAPKASMPGGVVAKNTEVSLSTYMSNAEIRYTTDGSVPTIGSNLYTEPITIVKNTVVKAVVVRKGQVVSEMLNEEYLIRAEKPSADRQSGYCYSVSLDITFSCATESVSYYYTTDGSTPTQSSAVCTGQLTIAKNTTLKVIAANSDFYDSEVLTLQYRIQSAAPSADLADGTYATAKTVTLSSPSANTTIYYTLDGSTPTTASNKYTSALELSSTTPKRMTLKYIAVTDGCVASYEVWNHYMFYSLGPAGGVVFYDCDADNDETNNGAGPDGLKSTDLGWRYLEAAPSDIASSAEYGFGFCRSNEGVDIYSNGGTTYTEGTTSATDGNCTGTKVGTGKANTAKLVAAMGESAYVTGSDFGGPEVSMTTSAYAAKLCDDYEYAGFSDWFLPSKSEMLLMQSMIHLNNLGSFASGGFYWSSSESGSDAKKAWTVYINNGFSGNTSRSSYNKIRPVRAFMSFED